MNDPITPAFAAGDRVSRHYAQRIKQIMARFNDIRELIQHEGMKGARVELEVRKFLIDFLPEIYQYSSGIVIDSSGNQCDRSKQEDILIIDRLYNPKIFLDEEPSVYPVEIVYCGVEVKTAAEARELTSAVANIASLKALQFVKEQVSYARSGGLYFSETSAPRGVIFVFDTSLRSDQSLLEAVTRATEGIDRALWPDLICILNRGIMFATKGGDLKLNVYGLQGRNQSGQLGTMATPAPTDELVVDGQTYPAFAVEGRYIGVDIARTFIAFITFLYDMLLSKVIVANSNLLRHYVPVEVSRCIQIQYTGGGESPDDRTEAQAAPAQPIEE